MKLSDVIERANKVVREGVNDPGIFKAIFLAGGPGSGKSFVASEIVGIPKGGFSNMDMSFAPSGLKVVNSDPEFEYFLKKQGVDPSSLGKMSDAEFAKVTTGANSPRGKAKTIKKAKEKLYVQGRLGLLIDGTGDDYGKISTKVKELKKVGYDCYMIFVNTTLEVAQERNARRDRVLPEKMVQKIWSDVQKNMGRFQGLFKQNFIIVDNTDVTVAGPTRSGPNSFAKEINSGVKRFLRAKIKSGIAKMWIKNQRGG
jgi:hypothetical protein